MSRMEKKKNSKLTTKTANSRKQEKQKSMNKGKGMFGSGNLPEEAR